MTKHRISCFYKNNPLAHCCVDSSAQYQVFPQPPVSGQRRLSQIEQNKQRPQKLQPKGKILLLGIPQHPVHLSVTSRDNLARSSSGSPLHTFRTSRNEAHEVKICLWGLLNTPLLRFQARQMKFTSTAKDRTTENICLPLKECQGPAGIVIHTASTTCLSITPPGESGCWSLLLAAVTELQLSCPCSERLVATHTCCLTSLSGESALV